MLDIEHVLYVAEKNPVSTYRDVRISVNLQNRIDHATFSSVVVGDANTAVVPAADMGTKLHNLVILIAPYQHSSFLHRLHQLLRV